ncbi:MAG: hypothetical protein IJO53_00895, partial [Clostridia bacterium]|nr:hypothetical protein [Clostridia bacterium]
MEAIRDKDRRILRELAHKQLEFANCRKNEEILKKWDALAKGKRETPTVRLLFSNFEHEVVAPRLRCEGQTARSMEASIVRRLVGRELFDDDTPISPTYDIAWAVRVKPFGLERRLTRTGGMGFHIEPQIDELGEEIDKLRGGSFGVDREATRNAIAAAEDVFGDLLPVRMVQPSLSGAITNPLVHLMGMENYYLSMYDYPEALHEVMDMAASLYENYY